jgi:two-component system response regulator MprA
MATILVAEDNPSSRRPLVKLLRMQGYEVLTATDANQATALAHRGKPDLILLDVGMPPIDGLTFLSLLRAEPEGADIPVILITGLCDDNTRRRAEELGVREYLVKTQFTSQQLLGLVEQHLRKPEDSPA